MSDLYLYDSAREEFAFSPSTLENVADAASALDALAGAAQAAKQSGGSLDDFTLLIEQAMSQAAAQPVIGPDVEINGAAAQAGIAALDEAQAGVGALLAENKISLLREARRDLPFESTERDVTFHLDLNGLGCDSVTLKTEFASVRLDVAQAGYMTVNLRGMDQNELVGLEAEGAPPQANGLPLAAFWSIPVVLILLAAWGFSSLRDRLKIWVVPVVGFLLLAGNAISVVSNIRATLPSGGPAAPSEDLPIVAVKLRMDPPAQAVLSMPLGGRYGASLSFYNEKNERQLSKANPLAQSVMGWVTKSGVYAVMDGGEQFKDIDETPDVMREAILNLAAKGIMSGTTDGMFHPNKPITRAEVAAAVLNAFNLVDEDAACTFADVKKTDWYYAIAATAQKLKFIAGYDDNTFRADVDIPKDQMMVIASNTLMEYMGYYRPDDVAAQLRHFLDGPDIASWAAEGVALAAKSGMLIYRSDSRFEPAVPMARGDAAIVLNKMFSKVW